MPTSNQTANRRLADLITQHSHYIIAVEAGLAAMISGRLSDALSKAARTIAEMQIDPEAAIVYETARLLASFLVPEMQAAVRNIYVELRGDLLDLALAEDKAMLGMLNSVLPAPVRLAVDNAPLTAAAANSILSDPVAGTSLPTRIDRLVDMAAENVQAALANAVALNASMDELNAMLAKYIQAGVAGALTVLATTEAQRVANSARKLVFDSNRHILYGVQYVAVMDARTCPECDALDGTFYSYLDGDTPPNVPMHPWCRCVYIGVIKSWQDLGFKQADADSYPGLSSLTGESIQSEDYTTWLARQDKSVQARILGPVKYASYSSGVGKPPSSARAAVPLSTRPIRPKDIAYLSGM